MLNRRHFAAFTLMSIIGFGGIGPDYAEARQLNLKGTVVYRERMALPPNAKLEVQLLEKNNKRSKASIVANTSEKIRGSVPISFDLKIDDRKLKRGTQYLVKANIKVDGKTWFTNTDEYLLPADRREPLNIMVQRVSDDQDAESKTNFPYGQWHVREIGKRKIANGSNAYIRFEGSGVVNGSAGCNRFNGTFEISGNKIDFSKTMSTMMGCSNTLAEQERRMHAAIGDATSWNFDRRGNTLVLFDRRNQPLLSLARKN